MPSQGTAIANTSRGDYYEQLAQDPGRIAQAQQNEAEVRSIPNFYTLGTNNGAAAPNEFVWDRPGGPGGAAGRWGRHGRCGHHERHVQWWGHGGRARQLRIARQPGGLRRHAGPADEVDGRPPRAPVAGHRGPAPEGAGCPLRDLLARDQYGGGSRTPNHARGHLRARRRFLLHPDGARRAPAAGAERCLGAGGPRRLHAGGGRAAR